LNADEIRQRRELCSCSRPELAKVTGLSIGRIAALELGQGKAATPHELAALAQFFTPSSQPPITEEAPLSLQTEAGVAGDGQAGTKLSKQDERAARMHAELRAKYAEWNDEWFGLTKGSLVKVKGEEGDFAFQNHRVSFKGHSSVQVYGGKKGHALMRSFTADRILFPNGKPVLT
jgi:transcriptional regulator with XRE-family HTH domain